MLRLAIGILAAMVPATAFAQPDMAPDPAVRWSVAGDRTVIVREQPDPAAAEIATLSPGTDDVVITGTFVDIDEPAWMQVNLPGGGRGWIEATALRPTDGEPEAGFPLACVGTEPFWSLRVADGSAQWSDMSTETSAVFPASPFTGVVGRPGYAIASLEGPGGTRGFLAASRDYEGCSDGMSEFSFPFSVILSVPGGGAYEGCCSRGG
jgi:uncharacterized membrane protein